MNDTPSAAQAGAGNPSFETPITVGLGGFEFERRGWETIIRAGGRESRLGTHMFLRTVYRVLAHELALGKVFFYGGFLVHNLGDPMEGDRVKVALVGPALDPVEETFPKAEVRAFFEKLYEAFQYETYREWY